jgi:hypothetical protein
VRNYVGESGGGRSKAVKAVTFSPTNLSGLLTFVHYLLLPRLAQVFPFALTAQPDSETISSFLLANCI